MEHILEIETKKEHFFLILNQDYYSLGRSERNSIIVKDSQVSRHHATIIKQKTKSINNYCFKIYDGDLKNKKSSNGLLINQKYRSSHLLESGDLIRLGNNVKLSYYLASRQQIELLKTLYNTNNSSIYLNSVPQESEDTDISKKIDKSSNKKIIANFLTTFIGKV